MSTKDIKENINNHKKNEKNKEYSKKIGNYVLLSEIGTGTFSKVAKAFHIITEKEVAVKILQKDKIKDDIDIERILREMEILKKLIHPNICQLYETYSTVHNFYLMMEHITGGDLFDFITNNNYLSEKQSCKFFRQLISVIEYLNELGISHRDIKPENILLDNEHQNIKLIDFGLSNYFTEKKLLKSSCGSPCYASPEMLSGKPYLGITTDLWSAGIVLYSMLVGSLPFDDQELYELYKQINLGKFYLPSTLSLEAIDLLKRILNVDPKKRIGLEGIKEHKWFKMEENPMYKGINLEKEKLGYNLEVIKYVMKNFFGKENDLEEISQNIFIDMIKNYYCNKYTATYYLTKRYILKIDDKDLIFQKIQNTKIEDKKEKEDNKIEKNINMKYDKKICKKNIKENIPNVEEKRNKDKNISNNYIIKNNINLEIKREEMKKEDYNCDKNDNEKFSNVEDELKNKDLIQETIENASGQKDGPINNEFFKNNIHKQNKLDFNKKQNKNEENMTKRNYKKNELYLNNIKNTNLKTHYRNSIEIKQKKFTKNLLLKGAGKAKDNFISNINNTSNNSYIIKTWGNNSINHISKNNKITFINSGNNKTNNINYNNYLSYNSNNNSNYFPKSKHENSSSLNSFKKNKKQKPSSKKKKENKKKYNSNNNSYNNKLNSNSINKITSSKQKENNFNFYLINNYINQNDLKNSKNNSNLNSYNFGKITNSKIDDSSESKINFSHCYFIKTRKHNNMLKTIDLPGSYTSRYNTEMNNKKIQNLNSSTKPYNKIKVNLKTDTNKLSEANSPKFSKNKTKNIIIKRASLEKNDNIIVNNSYTNKSGRKKNNSILKLADSKNNIINEDKKLVNSFSVKKENFISNISKNNTNNKIQYQLYYLNESKQTSSNNISSNAYGNIFNSNLKNICLKPKGIWLKNHTKKINRRNSSNSAKGKNNLMIKENTTSNINHKNILKINGNDIYNKKKINNNSTQKSNYKNYNFKELFPIEENNKIFDIKCYFNTKRLKNKILLLNEGYLSNKCNSPKEFYSFNESLLNSIYHSDANIINNKNNKENKMKPNFSNIYNNKKNNIVKTEQNSSGEKTNSPISTNKRIKYIYKSKLSLY